MHMRIVQVCVGYCMYILSNVHHAKLCFHLANHGTFWHKYWLVCEDGGTNKDARIQLFFIFFFLF